MTKLMKVLVDPALNATMLDVGLLTNSWLARLLKLAGALSPRWLAYTCACAIRYCCAIVSATSGVIDMQKKCCPYLGEALLNALATVVEKSGNWGGFQGAG